MTTSTYGDDRVIVTLEEEVINVKITDGGIRGLTGDTGPVGPTFVPPASLHLVGPTLAYASGRLSTITYNNNYYKTISYYTAGDIGTVGIDGKLKSVVLRNADHVVEYTDTFTYTVSTGKLLNVSRAE